MACPLLCTEWMVRQPEVLAYARTISLYCDQRLWYSWGPGVPGQWCCDLQTRLCCPNGVDCCGVACCEVGLRCCNPNTGLCCRLSGSAAAKCAARPDSGAPIGGHLAVSLAAPPHLHRRPLLRRRPRRHRLVPLRRRRLLRLRRRRVPPRCRGLRQLPVLVHKMLPTGQSAAV
jgi:hypothetical protein